MGGGRGRGGKLKMKISDEVNYDSFILYLVYLFLQLLNFIIEFVDIVEEGKILVFDFYEFIDQLINVLNTSGFFDCVES